jgi:hypothetical protein
MDQAQSLAGASLRNIDNMFIDSSSSSRRPAVSLLNSKLKFDTIDAFVPEKKASGWRHEIRNK